MREFTYSRGQWTDGMSLSPWQSNEEFKGYLARIGYNNHPLSIGSENGPQIEVYPSDDESSFLAVVSPLGNGTFDVHLPDLPSLMMFMKDFGPSFSAIHAADEQAEISELLRKLFRAYHGHDSYNACQKCDPEGVAAARRWRERRQQKIAGDGQGEG